MTRLSPISGDIVKVSRQAAEQFFQIPLPRCVGQLPSLRDPELVVRNHHMLAVGGAGDQALIVGAEPRALPPLDL